MKSCVAKNDTLCYHGFAQIEHGELAMNVSLTPDLEQFVHGKVQSGRYNSSSEVIREALRLLEDHDRVRSAQLAEFNQELERRLASLDRGEQVDPIAARLRLLRKSQKPRKLSS
jgi:antitoxin ParD1/3/4